jgi:hypothetical protein
MRGVRVRQGRDIVTCDGLCDLESLGPVSSFKYVETNP